MNEKQDPLGSSKAIDSVVAGVLTSFVDEVAEREDMKDVAERLRVTIVLKGQLTEDAVRNALFGSVS